ncbi:MAG: hypothetical protein ACK5LC_02885 [Coprobacillaceae bacterium]
MSTKFRAKQTKRKTMEKTPRTGDVKKAAQFKVKNKTKESFKQSSGAREQFSTNTLKGTTKDESLKRKETFTDTLSSKPLQDKTVNESLKKPDKMSDTVTRPTTDNSKEATMSETFSNQQTSTNKKPNKLNGGADIIAGAVAGAATAGAIYAANETVFKPSSQKDKQTVNHSSGSQGSTTSASKPQTGSGRPYGGSSSGGSSYGGSSYRGSSYGGSSGATVQTGETQNEESEGTTKYSKEDMASSRELYISYDIIEHAKKLFDVSLKVSKFHTTQTTFFDEIAYYYGAARPEFIGDTRASVLKQLQTLSTDISLVSTHINEIVTKMLEHDEIMKNVFATEMYNIYAETAGLDSANEDFLKEFENSV